MSDSVPKPTNPFPLDGAGRALEPASADERVRRIAPENRQPFLLGAAVTYYILVGGPVLLVQAAMNGTTFTAYGPFLLYLMALIAKDVMQLLPLIVYRHGRHGLLHPLILTVSIWPIISEIPLIGSNLQPLLGLVLGKPVGVLEFVGSQFRTDSEVFVVMAQLELLQALGVLTLMAVYAACERHYHSKPGATEPAPAPVYAPERLKLLLLAAAISAALLVFAFVQSRGGVTAHLASLALGRARVLEGAGQFAVIAKVGLLSMMVWVCYSPRTVRQPWFIAALLLASVTIFVVAGSRGEALVAIIGTGMCWTVRTGRFPVKIAIMAIPFMLVAYGLLLTIRTDTGQDQRAGLTVTDRLTQFDYGDMYSAGSEEASMRVSMRGGPPVILEGFNVTDGPLWGSSYAAMFTWFIPRAIWRDKPRGVGSLYAQKFLGADERGNAVPVGLVAEAYWNFWIPGVFLIFGLTGLITFWVYHLYLRYGGNPFVAAAYVRFITDFALTADHTVPFSQGLAVLFVLWLGARVFAQERTPARSGVPFAGSYPLKVRS